MTMLNKLRNNHKKNIKEKYRHLFVIIESINNICRVKMLNNKYSRITEITSMLCTFHIYNNLLYKLTVDKKC